MSGRKSKDKGYRFENACVKAFKAFGFDCRRMPLSGALGGEWAGDLRVALDGRDRIFQLKCLKDGYRTIYGALKGHDGLIIKADHEEPLVVLPLSFFFALAGEPDILCSECGKVIPTPKSEAV